MRKAKLYTANYEYVAEVTVPLFLTPPDVMVWSNRTFMRVPNSGEWLYRECFAYYVPPEVEAT